MTEASILMPFDEKKQSNVKFFTVEGESVKLEEQKEVPTVSVKTVLTAIIVASQISTPVKFSAIDNGAHTTPTLITSFSKVGEVKNYINIIPKNENTETKPIQVVDKEKLIATQTIEVIENQKTIIEEDKTMKQYVANQKVIMRNFSILAVTLAIISSIFLSIIKTDFVIIIFAIASFLSIPFYFYLMKKFYKKIGGS